MLSQQNNIHKNYNQNYDKQLRKVPEHKPLELPKEYVRAAEEVMIKLGKYNEKTGTYFFKITTSKIRSFLSLSNDIYNIEIRSKDENLTEESINKLNRMRVRILYEAGRYEEVKAFVENSKIISYIKGIGTSRKKFLDFAQYLEALVAYHRFLGGKSL
ncbi:MAG TPA: type III-A CRISPR-associated protein Csm2 [Clostridiales bacterium]|nr:type III-A CRISPR-associated protein Csm2 [Clostridiales bacterium]